MKIKKINNNNFLNLFHVILLRLHSFDENLNVIGANLKRVLKILFNFHRSKKQICFIGPAVIIKPLSSIDKKNQHMYLPEESIKQGFLSNIRVKSKKYFSIVKMPECHAMCLSFKKKLQMQNLRNFEERTSGGGVIGYIFVRKET